MLSSPVASLIAIHVQGLLELLSYFLIIIALTMIITVNVSNYFWRKFYELMIFNRTIETV